MSKVKSYKDATLLINKVLDDPPIADGKENLLSKETTQEGYTYIATNIYNKTFLNWGIWDKKVYKEYCDLHYNFSALCPYQDPLSPLFLYYVLRPLMQQYFFNKRILDVGSGNGIGLKMASQLLRTDYALGVDLNHQLVCNASNNFYTENKLNFIHGDAEQLPLEKDSVDLITNIESSHLYPHLELFFAEVFRVLAPGGFFCYSDLELLNKLQSKRLDVFLESKKDIRIIIKQDITKLVQNAIYMRLITNEKQFIEMCASMFGTDPNILASETRSLAESVGISFLPWWKIRVKTPLMPPIAKAARQEKYWSNKHYFYYLIQKV